MKSATNKLISRTLAAFFILVLMLVGSVRPGAAFQPFEPFKFAYVTDVHLTNDVEDSYKLTRESQLFLQQLIKQLNEENLDFVVFGGDQVETIGKDERNWQLFTDILQGLRAPWHFVLGESDVSGNLVMDKRKTFGADWKHRGIQSDTPYWSYQMPDRPTVQLIGLDTTIPNSITGGISQKQLDWLKKELEANKKSFMIIFSHHPLLPPAPYDSGPPWDEYVIPDSGAVREVIGSQPNVKLILSGHTHVSKVQNEREAWHISNPSLSVYPCAFRIFQVTPQKVTMETRQIEFGALIKKARKELTDSTLASRYNRDNPELFVDIVEGAAEDRHAIIPMVFGGQLVQYSPEKARKENEKARKRAVKEAKRGRKPPVQTAHPAAPAQTPAPQTENHSAPQGPADQPNEAPEPSQAEANTPTEQPQPATESPPAVPEATSENRDEDKQPVDKSETKPAEGSVD